MHRTGYRQTGSPRKAPGAPEAGRVSPFASAGKACSGMLLALLLMLPWGTPLHAEDFQRFSVLIPFGWKVTEKTDMLSIRSPDGDAAAVIICAPLPNQRPARDVLEDYVRYFSGSEPQQRNETCHAFSFTRNGVQHIALFIHDAHAYLLLTVSDPRNRYPECLSMLTDSLVLRKDSEATTP